MSTRLILARHGETAWNREQRYQGQQDVPLTELGRRQAGRLAERLARAPIDVAYCSDLGRAVDTARIVLGERALEPIPDPALREMSFGRWEGLQHPQIEAQYPAELAAWLADPVENGPPGGEPLKVFAARVGAALDTILAAHHGRQILIVAHGGPLRMIACKLLELPVSNYWRLAVDTCALAIIDVYREGAIVGLWNDTCHLAGLGATRFPTWRGAQP